MVRVASVEVSISGGRLVQGAAWPVQRQLSTAADITTLRGTQLLTLSYCHSDSHCHTVIVTLSSSCHDDLQLAV